MINREKVIKGLVCCCHTDDYNCAECPYTADSDCTAVMSMDVLYLLKEHETEPKTVLYREDGQYCPYCSTITTRAMGVQRLHRGTNFCPYCGKGVMWDD